MRTLASMGCTEVEIAAMSDYVGRSTSIRALLDELGLKPILDLGMRLGEASAAAVGVLLLRAALACHTGMATFAEAGVSDKPDDGSRDQGTVA